MRMDNIPGDDVLQVDRHGDRKGIIVVGNLSARKGLRVLLPLIEELQNVDFEFVGEPDDKEGERTQNDLKRFSNVVLHVALDRRKTLGKIEYNTERPHSALGYRSPSEIEPVHQGAETTAA